MGGGGGLQSYYAAKLKKFTYISYMRFVLKSVRLNFFTFLVQFAKFWKASLASPCPSVRPHGTTRLPLEGVSWNLIRVFFENLFRKFKFHYHLTRITGNLYKDQYKSMAISCLVLRRMKNVSNRIAEKIKTHIWHSCLLLKIVPVMK